MDPIKKRTYTVTVLSRDSDTTNLDNCSDMDDPFDLLALHREIFDGAWIGQSEANPWEDVSSEKVQAELLALGNDGTFFNDDDN